MARNNKPHDDHGELELSNEMAELEDSISLEEINARQAKEQEAETQGALYTDEELKQQFEESPTDLNAIPTLETPEEENPDALYDSDTALEQAVDNLATQEVNKPPATPAPTVNTDSKTAIKAESAVNSTNQVTMDLSVFFPDAKTAENHSNTTPPDITEGGLNNSPPGKKIDCDDSLDKQNFQAALNLAMEAEIVAPVKKPKSTIAEKAKALLSKNKAQFDEYFGRSLPERELDLGFIFPPQKAKKDLEPIVSTRDINKLFAIKGTSLNVIFKKSEEDLAKLVKCKLSKSQQLSLLDNYSQSLFEKFSSVIALYEKRPCASDNKQVEMAEHALNVIKHLITGYKQVYAEIYQSANTLYGPQRETANTVAFQLLELIALEQRLAGTLHTQIPHASVKTFNTLFHALARYEPQTIGKHQHSAALDTQTTLEELFIRYQYGLLLDLMQLSSSQYKLLNNYLRLNIKNIQLLPLDYLPTTDESIWIISHDSSDAPRLLTETLRAQISNSHFSPLCFRFQPFLNQIKQDYQESLNLFANNQSAHSSTVFETSTIEQTLTLLSTLNKLTTMIETQTANQSYSLYQAIKLRAYSGLSDSSSYFTHLCASQNIKSVQDEENEKELPAKPVASKNQWQCAMQDENSIHLQTIEAAAKIEMDIGVLLLLVITNDEQEEIIPARITRLEREAQGKIKLILEKLGDQSTCISLAESPCAILTLQGEKRYLLTADRLPLGSQQAIEGFLPDGSKIVNNVVAFKAVSKNLQILELF